MPQPVLWTIGLAFVAFLGLILAVGYNAPNSIPGRSYYTISAEFDDADNLSAHSQVRVAGRYVGQVLNLRVEHGRAVVDLQLEPEIGPLRSDTKVRVRPRSPIGVRFVDLSPGRRGAPMPDGATIPATQASTSTALDTVLNTLDTRRRQRAGTLMRELGTGVAGRGATINALIASGRPAVRGLERIAGAINARDGAPQRFVAGAQAAAAAADPVRETIRAGIGSGKRALRPFADGGNEIADALVVAPASLTGATSALRRTDPFLAALRGLSRDAVPTLRPAAAGLAETAKLLRDSHDGLVSLEETLGIADDAIPPTLALLHTTDPVLPSASRALRTSLPLVREFGARGCDLALFNKIWGSMLGFGVPGGRKDLGLIDSLRMDVLLSEEALGGAAQRGAAVVDDPYPAPCTVRRNVGSRR